MATLYFHIPFCKRICTYCDFYKVGAVSLIPKVVEAMHRELDERCNYLAERHLTSIYFGGGTPSLLTAEQIEGIISHARRLFDCSDVEEITFEANPDDLTEAVDEMDDDMETLNDYIEEIDEDLGNLEEIVYEELDDEFSFDADDKDFDADEE